VISEGFPRGGGRGGGGCVSSAIDEEVRRRIGYGLTRPISSWCSDPYLSHCKCQWCFSAIAQLPRSMVPIIQPPCPCQAKPNQNHSNPISRPHPHPHPHPHLSPRPRPRPTSTHIKLHTLLLFAIYLNCLAGLSKQSKNSERIAERNTKNGENKNHCQEERSAYPMAQTNGKVQTRLTAFHATSTSTEVESGWTIEDGAGNWELAASS